MSFTEKIKARCIRSGINDKTKVGEVYEGSVTVDPTGSFLVYSFDTEHGGEEMGDGVFKDRFLEIEIGRTECHPYPPIQQGTQESVIILKKKEETVFEAGTLVLELYKNGLIDGLDAKTYLHFVIKPPPFITTGDYPWPMTRPPDGTTSERSR